MRRAALLLILLAACATVPPPAAPPDLWGDPVCAFAQIGLDYCEQHDCDDMAQEWRDYLVAHGIAVERIRFGLGYIDGSYHCWTEVEDTRDGRWYAFDPAGGVYSVPYLLMRAQVDGVVEEYPGHAIILDGTGYEGIGDRWWGGTWHRGAREREDSEAPARARG